MLMLVKYLRARRTQLALGALDDSLLKDIGISRSDVTRIANGDIEGPYAIRRDIRFLSRGR